MRMMRRTSDRTAVVDLLSGDSPVYLYSFAIEDVKETVVAGTISDGSS